MKFAIGLRIFFLNLILLYSLSALASLLAYKPSYLNSRPLKVIVVIHGCLQSSESMALGSGWNKLADENNLYVIYPQVPAASHPLDCWTWYLPQNQKSESGQLHNLHNEIQQHLKQNKIEAIPTYLVGLSSGAITAAGLAACFPTSYKGLAIHSGTSYGLADNATKAESVLKDGPPENPPSNRACSPSQFNGRLIVIHGLNDQVVNSKHAEKTIDDYLLKKTTLREERKKENNLFYTQQDFIGSNRAQQARLILIEELGHSWPGVITNLRKPGFHTKYPTAVPFFTEIGPSSTDLIFRYFSEKNF